MRQAPQQLIVLFAAALLFACSGEDSDGNSNSGTPDGGGGGQESVIPTSTGVDVADRLGRAAEQCGVQSPNTVPAGWEMTMVGSLGCMASAPAGWIADGAGQAMTSIVADYSGTTGYFAGGGVPDISIDCTPRGAADYWLVIAEAADCTSASIVWYMDDVLRLVTTDFPIGHAVFTCNLDGTPVVGYSFSMAENTGFACSINLNTFWLPESRIEADTCLATQVFHSIRCPGGGGVDCDDTACSASCQSDGYTSGVCNEEGDCVCW